MVGETEPISSKIKGWLLRKSLSEESAQGVVDRLTGFHNLRRRNISLEDTVMCITGSAPDFGTPHLAVYLLWPAPIDLSSLAQSKQINELGKVFSTRVSTPIRPAVSFRLELVSPNHLYRPDSFAGILQRSCTPRNRITYLGVIEH
ncbi:MAG: hypothetical protein Q8P92_03530 [Candidatus Daviesbacteria bacterium]|nr:hypothetical protein [Candidatus Daviesbacteria bacterium]